MKITTPQPVNKFGDAVPAVRLSELTTEEDWQHFRRRGIGGSDAAALIGTSPWDGPYSIWLQKVKGLNKDLGEYGEWGHRLEPVVADAYAERNGVRLVECPYVLAHPNRDWQLGNIDRAVASIDGKFRRGLEIKTTSARNWDGEISASWFAQVQHYMAVTNTEAWDIAALIGGQKYEQFTVERDDQFIERLVNVEGEFWEHNVLNEVPPPPDETRTMSELLGSMPAIGSVELDEEVRTVIEELKVTKQTIKELGAVKTQLENKVKAALGDNEEGTHRGMPIVKWPSYEVNRIDSKALKRMYPDVAEEVTNTRIERRMRFVE